MVLHDWLIWDEAALFLQFEKAKVLEGDKILFRSPPLSPGWKQENHFFTFPVSQLVSHKPGWVWTSKEGGDLFIEQHPENTNTVKRRIKTGTQIKTENVAQLSKPKNYSSTFVLKDSVSQFCFIQANEIFEKNSSIFYPVCLSVPSDS